MKLTDYEVDADRGFLPGADPLTRLPAAYQAWEETAAALPDLLASGEVRQSLRQVPPLDVAALGAADGWRRAMLLLSYFGHAYIWGEDPPPEALPANLAAPWAAVAEELGRPPVLSYASYALDNWRRLEPGQPIALGNLGLLQPFLGGLDEAWFILVHVAIEAEAAAALRALPIAVAAADRGDTAALRDALAAVAETLAAMHATLQRMPERCDPYIYFRRVRPYIHGWQDHPAFPDGLRYEGVAAYGGHPQQFRGETGAQSGIIPALDAALGVQHPDTALARYLREMLDYMPPAHRQFVVALRDRSRVRGVLEESHDAAARRVYNQCLRTLARFRSLHLDYARRYIFEQGGGDPANPRAVGTGGTPFLPYLEEHRDTTLAHLLPE